MARVVRKGDSIADLADFLADQLGRPVKDATGLHARYDYALTFVMEPRGLAAGPETAPGSNSGVSLADAVRQQLGLVLNKSKGEVEVLVVDSIKKIPSEN